MTVTFPVPVTASVLAKDLAERALWTAGQALLPFLALALAATSWDAVKVIGMSALAAVGSALLSLVKGIVVQHFTGTASTSRAVGEASTAVPPIQPDDGPVYDARHARRPQPGPLQEQEPPL